MIELFAEALDPVFIALLVAEASVGPEVIFVLLRLLDLVLVFEDVRMQVVEGSAGGLAPVITCGL